MDDFDSRIKRLSSNEVREIITFLNRANLESLDYSFILKKIGDLIKGVRMVAHSIPVGTLLYRGVIHEQKPTSTSWLGTPPSDLVTNFQRCNPPGRPMFYCSVDPIPVFNELRSIPENIVYMSKWEVTQEFLYFRMPPPTPENEIDNLAFSRVETFIETRFSHPIHDTFSAQYKITSAITEKFCPGAAQYQPGAQELRPLGAVVFPSVAHSSRAENMAIHPKVAADCLRLIAAREVEIKELEGDARIVQELDFSDNFTNNMIHWRGTPFGWHIGPGQLLQFTVEDGKWIARTADGIVVEPS